MKAMRFLALFLFLINAESVFAQRNSQIEFYAGAAFPMGPDFFKEYTKVGLSGNLQYVVFPSPRFGVTFNVGYERFSNDNEKFTNAFSLANTGFTADYYVQNNFVDDNGDPITPGAEITSTAIRFGAGIRPYLTSPEASTQIFLLGQVNYNLIQNDWSATDLPFGVNPLGGIRILNADDDDFERIAGENDENKFGFGGGAGLEIPAGSSFNIVLQGLFNIILTEDESTTFLGVTAGLVF